MLDAIICGADPVRLSISPGEAHPARLPEPSYVDAVLKIATVSGMAVYRIVDYDARIGAYIGQWPD